MNPNIGNDNCPTCSHPPHIGACSRRMGGTAYGCGCLRDTPTPPAPAPTRPRVSTAGSGQEARLVVTPAAPSRPADDAIEARLKELRDWLIGANADLAYIDKAVTAAGYHFSTTEAQPEHVVEVTMFIDSLKRERDEWKARAERAEAERDEARNALAGHLFDGESLSLREAIRSEMLKDYARAINAHDAATARATKAEAEAALLRARIDAPSTRRDEKTAPNPTDPRNHAAAAASGAAGTERKEP